MIFGDFLVKGSLFYMIVTNVCDNFFCELIGIVIGGVSLVEVVKFYMNATTTVLFLVTIC